MGHVSLFQFQAPLHGCSLVRVGRRQFCFTLTISWTMPSTWEVTVTNTGVGGCSSVGCYERAGVSNQEHCHAQPQSLPSPFLPGERLPSSSWLLTAGDTRLENRKLWYPALLYYSKPCASFQGGFCIRLFLALLIPTHKEQETNSKISRGSILWFHACWMSMFLSSWFN